MTRVVTCSSETTELTAEIMFCLIREAGARDPHKVIECKAFEKVSGKPWRLVYEVTHA